MRYEIFETFSDQLVIFLGINGFDGVLCHRPPADWDYFRGGSIVWDGFHQEVYRNHRATALTREELEQRRIPFPDLRPYTTEPAPFVDWKENFSSSIPLQDVPAELLDYLRDKRGIVYLVLVEDLYETRFGDGRFVYPAAVFHDSDSAESYGAEQHDEWHEYTIKRIVLEEDTSDGTLRSDLRIEPYEHYSLESVLRLIDSSRQNS